MDGPMNGLFSIIQYCRDPSRAEAANVGVILVCPAAGYAGVRVSKGNDRIRRFFGRQGVDLAAVDAAKTSIANRVRVDADAFRTREALEKFVATRANEVVLTRPRQLKVDDVEKTLNALFEELVGGRSHASRRESFDELDQLVSRPALRDKVERGAVVTIPVLGRSFRAPYAFRNGRLNLVRPERFSSRVATATDTAVRLAIEGDLLEKHPLEQGDRARLIVVPRFPEHSNGEIREPVLRLLNEYHVRTVEESNLEELAQEIAASAHH